MIEEFRDIKNYEGYYQISNFGRVKSLERIIIRNNSRKLSVKERILKPCLAGRKHKLYLTVNLHKNGKGKMHTIHRLVMNHFKPNPNPEIYTEIDHIRDGNILFNSIDDLEWVTHSENQRRRFRRDNGKHPMLGKFGKNNWHSKSVLQIDKNTGKIIAKYDSMGEVKRKIEIPTSNICECCKNKRKSAGGFIWKYKL